MSLMGLMGFLSLMFEAMYSARIGVWRVTGFGVFAYLQPECGLA